ncbi:Nucleolar complex protein 3 homolog [Seminavis robusta]|uniref:Nucleolar complex protein 3 homolog n=1 Tax=Seminavis robusta TaxID=568900 RepID=A0A9N8EK13_9STRA|nr:Nucleolar complex protein 3 homolog [Seminavis robusta]|eukprot:Sro1310_g261690.1 Nucleolar complex protein 3 homolog (653) ;mRNA; f:23958-25916
MGSKKKKQKSLVSGSNKAPAKAEKVKHSAAQKKKIKEKKADFNKSKKIRSGTVTREETCDMIAELSESILEDPTKAFSSPDAVLTPSNNTDSNDDALDDAAPKKKETPSMMKQLLQIASFEGDEYTAQLGILSLLAIYRDLIPSYRIRLPTAAEMSVKVSLETKRLWDYERALMTNYQQYLKLLENLWNNGKSQKSLSTLTVTSMLCMCELLKAAFHFNFRSNLLNMVMRQVNNGQCEEVSNACCSAVEHVFANDTQGEVALEATRILAKAIKDRGFKVRPSVLRTFLSLPLRVHVDEAQAAKLATQARKRKRDKDLKAIDKELQEGDATVDKVLLARCQSDTLEAVTVSYFRILKSDNLNSMKELLPACLEGLAKFAHLINIDTVMDLLEVLKQLLKDIDALPLDAALNCVLTAFQTLSGPGKEMKIDQKEYISPLYTQLPRLITMDHTPGADGDTNARRKITDAMLRCLDAAFIKRREYSTTRVAAFFKQILTVAMYTPPSTAVPLVAFARQLLQRYHSCQQLLENESDAITSGQYCPDVDDPELSNPFSTSGWELAALKFHVHPGVANQAKCAATLKMLQMPAEDPDRLLEDTTTDENELYIKFRKIKKRHPLEARGQNDDKKRRRVRFIQQPVKRDLTHLETRGIALV